MGLYERISRKREAKDTDLSEKNNVSLEKSSKIDSINLSLPIYLGPTSIFLQSQLPDLLYVFYVSIADYK